MRPSLALWQNSITLFTKPHCLLCAYAKQAIVDASKQSNFKLTEIDITKPANSQWFEDYQYDIPVVHVQRANSEKKQVFMHRIKPEQLLDALA